MHSHLQSRVCISPLLERCEDSAIQRSVNVGCGSARQITLLEPSSKFFGLREYFCCCAWSHSDHLGEYLGRAGIAWTDNDSCVDRIDVADLDQPTGVVSADDHRETIIVVQPRIDRVSQCMESIVSRYTMPKRAGSHHDLHRRSISCNPISGNDRPATVIDGILTRQQARNLTS